MPLYIHSLELIAMTRLTITRQTILCYHDNKDACTRKVEFVNNRFAF